MTLRFLFKNKNKNSDRQQLQITFNIEKTKKFENRTRKRVQHIINIAYKWVSQ